MSTTAQFPATAFGGPGASAPSPLLLPAAIFCLASYVDNPNDPNVNGLLNIEAAVQAVYPTCKVVWSSTNTYDDNYAYIVQTPDDRFFLAIRGSLPFEDDGHTVIDWGVIANWLVEDFGVYTQREWPYVNSGQAYVAHGTMTGFTNIRMATNFFGNTGQAALDFLKQHAVAAGHPVYITGHSLGGNMANVYASYFAQECPTAEASVFSFAAPAAGNQAFVDDLQAKYGPGKAYHYEMQYDIIPRFPVVAGIESLKQMFSADCLATSIACLDVTLADTLQGVADTLKGDADIHLIDPYVATTINTGNYPLSDQYQSNTFEDWFGQAGYQHSGSHYVSIFLDDPTAIDRIVAALAPQIVKAKAVYTVAPVSSAPQVS